MTTRRGRSRKGERGLQRHTFLERLGDSEARTLLLELLEAHPTLRDEADERARAIVGEVDSGSLPACIEASLRSFTLDDIEERSGDDGLGYSSPPEAAYELLEEALEPYLSDMERQLDSGLVREAVENGKGVLLGLYRVREEKDDEALATAEDFPVEAAKSVIRLLSREKGASGKKRPRAEIDEALIREQLPEWSEALAQATR
jgi:hypothetical protein